MSDAPTITEWLTVREIAEALKVTQTYVRASLIGKGKLRARKIGRTYRVSVSEYERFCGRRKKHVISDDEASRRARAITESEGVTLRTWREHP